MLQDRRRFSKLSITASVATLGAVAAISGCGSSSPSNASQPGKSSGSTTVQVLALDYDSGMSSWAASTMKAFNASHSNVKLKITVEPPDQLDQILTTRVQGGDPPDISAMATAWMPAFVKANALQNLQTILPSSLLNLINQNLLTGSTYNGVLGALPYAASSRLLFYNKADFAKAGITSPPRTWAELESDAVKIKAAHAAPYPFGLVGNGTEAFAAWFPYVYWSYGGTFGSGSTLTIDQAACTQGLTQYYDMVNRDKTTEPNPQTYAQAQVEDLWKSGQIAMTIWDPLLVSLTPANIQFGVAPVPGGTEQTTLGVADGWAVFKQAKASQSAITTVLQYLMAPSQETPFVIARDFLPTEDAASSNSHFSTPALAPFVQSLKIAKFAPLNPQWGAINNQGAKIIQSLYASGNTPANACKQLAAAIQNP